ncbi:MAG TPA: universal stress protein, partial [Thermoanaerobaculia bacterium]|nr:universal stress protein [Thermoanaerobaculia bacterium]
LGACERALGQEVGLYSGRTRELAPRLIERRYRAEAARLRAAVARSAARARVRWSFRVGRGTVAGELLRLAEDNDLAVVGRSGWSAGSASRLGPIARQILITGPRRTLLVRPRVNLPLPLVLVYDGSVAARRAAELAWRFRSAEDQEVVAVVPGGEKERKRREAEILEVVQWASPPPRVISAKSASAADLLRTARRVGCGILVLPGGGEGLEREALLAVAEAIESPVLVVR